MRHVDISQLQVPSGNTLYIFLLHRLI